MVQTHYIRTDEREEAVRSLEWAGTQARSLLEEPHQWKWVLIALHNAVQGFMVLALWQGNGLLTLRDNIAAKWLTAYREGGEYPTEKLDGFLNLYRKVKDINNFHSVGASPFAPGDTHDRSLSRLNSFRNEFIHFTPKGWSLELAGLPRVCTDALDIVEFFGWFTPVILWHDEERIRRGKQAVECLRCSMAVLDATYTAAD